MKQVIENYYQAFNQKKWQQMLSLVDENVLHEINEGVPVQGKNEFARFLQVMDEAYDEKLTDIIILENGERYAAEFICHGVYKKSQPDLPPAKGQKYSLRVGCFFELKNNKITRITNYYNLNNWLKQVGV
jgi:steroid delta-isomerase-like uncharacterized protein